MLSFRFPIYVTTRILVPSSAFLCSLAFSLTPLFIVLTGSVVLASLNVDPVLFFTAYPFILPLWIAQTHVLVTRNHTFPF